MLLEVLLPFLPLRLVPGLATDDEFGARLGIVGNAANTLKGCFCDVVVCDLLVRQRWAPESNANAKTLGIIRAGGVATDAFPTR